MNKKKNDGIGFFEKYLTLWVILCMIIGVLIGKFIPFISEFVVFKPFIPVELAQDYLAGAILLGAAPCTAMVFVWSYLTKGNAAYTVVQVATNDLL